MSVDPSAWELLRDRLRRWGVKVSPWKPTDESLTNDMDYPPEAGKPLKEGKRSWFGIKISWRW